jgi:hypothetical protein
MVEIEKYPCLDSNEAHARERHWFEILNASLNSNKPILFQDEIKQNQIKYYELNKEKLIKFQLEYNKINKDKIKEYYTEYNKINKDKIKEYYTEYNKINKDKIKEYQKAYRNHKKQEQLMELLSEGAKHQ